MATTPPGEDTEHEEYNEREATEMDSYDGVGSTDQILGPGLPPSANPDARKMGYFNPLKAFWARQVSVTVPHEACRDHFALERTFLGYLRTSLALSVIAVIIAQLFGLQHAESPNKIFGFFVLGIPLACACIVAAILVLLLGTYRTWRQQNAMLRGKVYAGGWEINAIGLVVLMITLTLFVLLVAVDARKDR